MLHNSFWLDFFFFFGGELGITIEGWWLSESGLLATADSCSEFATVD